ncbi:MAG: ubiquinone/menaquinone biosynthesis methyltransferase [Actinomycetota bacterium]
MSSMPTDQLPEGDEKRSAVQSMFDTIAPRYDLVNRIMTFRMDVGWRKKTRQAMRLQPGSVILDLAAGTGDFCVDLAKNGHRPIGVDLSYGMLAAARTDAPLVQGDLLQLPMADASVDAAVCGFALRNLVSLPPFFEELHRVVKPGGRIGLLDVSKPDNAILEWGHGFYFNRLVPLIGGALSNRSAYAYLPKSVSYLPPPAEMMAMLERAGLVDVDRTQLSGGISQLITATRPDTTGD